MACTIEGFLISLMAQKDTPSTARKHQDFHLQTATMEPSARGHRRLVEAGHTGDGWAGELRMAERRWQEPGLGHSSGPVKRSGGRVEAAMELR